MEPNDMKFWVDFAFQLVGIIFVIVPLMWKLVKSPLENQIDGLGVRVSRNEHSCATFDGKIQSVEKQMEVSIFDRASIHERMGSLEEKFERFLVNAENDRRAINKDDQKILERLASIEAKVDVASTIKTALLELRGVEK